MTTITSCRFCNIANGNYHHIEIDKPFADNNEFMAVASIGALVEGWSLIIPKEHQLSMRDVYTDSIFSNFVNSIVPVLNKKYGSLIAFEHGSNKEGSITSCGTDHAHLHLVPFKETLLPALMNTGLNWMSCKSSEVRLKAGRGEYLFYSELKSQEKWQDPIGYFHFLKTPISQFFRQVIASQLGITESYDYRKFPNLENARQTRKVLAESTI